MVWRLLNLWLAFKSFGFVLLFRCVLVGSLFLRVGLNLDVLWFLVVGFVGWISG